jgi:hypothetical protein
MAKLLLVLSNLVVAHAFVPAVAPRTLLAARRAALSPALAAAGQPSASRLSANLSMPFKGWPLGAPFSADVTPKGGGGAGAGFVFLGFICGADCLGAVWRVLSTALSARRKGVLAVAVAAVLYIFGRVLNSPSRVYDASGAEQDGVTVSSTGREYDAWTSEGILEYASRSQLTYDLGKVYI